MPNRINNRDLAWVVLILVSFIFALAVSWQRWGNPLVDCGREMNQPLRLARGEMLYSDVRHIYGPLSPYINALLYTIFDPSLTVLYFDGFISAATILAGVYWLSRQLMPPLASTAATLSVMWLCAFKQAGNYILPYSYSALHGCALGLISLILLIKAVGSENKDAKLRDAISPEAPSTAHSLRTTAYWLAAAGIMTGITTLAKTEMGLAALIAGIVAAALMGYPDIKRALALVAIFATPAIALIVTVYAFIASRTGWHALAYDSFLFLRNLSPELVYFNKRVSGFDQPVQSLVQMIGAAARVGALAIIIASLSLLLTRGKKDKLGNKHQLAGLTSTDAGRASSMQVWGLLALSIITFLSIPLTGGLSWEKGPYLAMPLLLAGLLIGAFINYQKQVSKSGFASANTIVLIVIGVYALASLARVILRVRSGGAYSSYLLPASVVLFTYAWVHPFAGLFRNLSTRRLARNMAIGLILADVALTAGLLAYRYRDRNTYPIKTARGTIIAVPDLGQAVAEAIEFINQKTAPGEAVAVMPEGTSLNFFTDRPNPIREEITTPGFLDEEGERRAIRQIDQSNARYVFVANRATPEFGPAIFGKDYCVELMKWIEDNFEPVAVLGPDHSLDLEIGDKTFFIKAYKKKQSPPLASYQHGQ